MVSIILFALLAIFLPFVGVVFLSLALLSICDARNRLLAFACFAIPAVGVPAALFAVGSSSGVLRYSAQGPIISFMILPVLGLFCVGVVGAGFVFAAVRRRLLRSKHDVAARRTI